MLWLLSLWRPVLCESASMCETTFFAVFVGAKVLMVHKKRFRDTRFVYFVAAYHRCMFWFLYADIDECFVMNAGFLLGLFGDCLVNYTKCPVDFKYIFYFA